MYLQNRSLLAHTECQVLATATYILTGLLARNKVICGIAYKSSLLNIFSFWTLEQASCLNLHLFGKL